MTIFTGLSAFPITPADAEGRVRTDALGALVARAVAGGVHSIGLLGSTGTYAYLCRAERRRAVAAGVEAAAGTVPLIVGVGALRTDAACDLARDAAAAGADGVLLAPVSYTPLTQDEAYEHFRAVARATDLPLCIYNNPGTTHFTFGRELLGRLAAVPGIAAVKMPLPGSGSVAEDLAALRGVLPSGFAVGYSGDWGCAEALLAGADAWYSVLGGLFPKVAVRLTEAARAGDVATTQRLDAELAPLWATFRDYGSLRVVIAAAQLLGLSDCAAPRPILPLGPAETDRVAAAIAGLSG